MNKTAIIIGASSEIGLATAKKMNEKGWNLALTYNKNIPNVEGLSNFKTYQVDLTKNDEICDFFSKVEKDFKTLDSLIFCAGVAQKRKLIFDVTDEEIDNIFQVNTLGAIRCVKHFAKIAVEKENSSIVLVGSFVEKCGCSCESVYVSSKSALSGLCRSISSELGNFGVRINVVAPGFIDTKMNNNLSQAEKEDISDMTPLQRLGTAEDVASAIAYLASNESSFITGQTLSVDGGLILQ